VTGLPDFVATPNETVVLSHIDCAIYSSTRDAFAVLARHLVRGTTIVFGAYCGVEYKYSSYAFDSRMAVRTAKSPATVTVASA